MLYKNTLIVPARPEGFRDVFLKQKVWYSVPISEQMLPYIMYLAIYQVAPISAITHYVKVDKIEKYKNTRKYILYFSEEPKEIKHVKLDHSYKALAPQTHRYTNLQQLLGSEFLTELLSPPKNGWKRTSKYLIS
jgi:hypothetical protein